MREIIQYCILEKLGNKKEEKKKDRRVIKMGKENENIVTERMY